MTAWCQAELRPAAAALALLWLAACASPAPREKPAPAEPPAPQAFYWEAQAPNGTPLYLLGSVHIGDGRNLALSPRVEQGFESASELIVELDTTTLSPVEAVDVTNRFGLLPGRKQLRQVVHPETYAQIAAYMKTREYDMERVDRMRPWLVAQVVTQLEYAAAGLNAENGVDAALIRRASGRMPIEALESLDEQVAIFADMPDAMQETMLIEMLREATDFVAVTRAILAAWEQGDEQRLEQLLFANAGLDRGLDEFYERVFFARNERMAERLEALAQDGRPRFVVVGAGHLIGPRGIPELLAARGYRVARVGGGMRARTAEQPAARPATSPGPRRAGKGARRSRRTGAPAPPRATPAVVDEPATPAPARFEPVTPAPPPTFPESPVADAEAPLPAAAPPPVAEPAAPVEPAATPEAPAVSAPTPAEPPTAASGAVEPPAAERTPSARRRRAGKGAARPPRRPAPSSAAAESPVVEPAPPEPAIAEPETFAPPPTFPESPVPAESATDSVPATPVARDPSADGIAPAAQPGITGEGAGPNDSEAIPAEPVAVEQPQASDTAGPAVPTDEPSLPRASEAPAAAEGPPPGGSQRQSGDPDSWLAQDAAPAPGAAPVPPATPEPAADVAPDPNADASPVRTPRSRYRPAGRR